MLHGSSCSAPPRTHSNPAALQSTGEAAANALELTPGTECGFVSTCRETALQFIANHFPVLIPAAATAGEGRPLAGRRMQACREGCPWHLDSATAAGLGGVSGRK